MPSRVRRFPRLLLATALLGLEVFLGADPAPAQAPKGAASQRLTPAKDFTKEGRDDARQFQDMRRGAAQPQAAVIDRAAQWYAYRLTWIEFQDTSRVGERSIKEITREAMDQIPTPPPGKPLTSQQQAFMQEFGKQLTDKLKEVLAKNARPIVRVNAAMILARLGEAGQEPVADVLAGLLKDENESPAVKFWALKGLANLFAQTRGPNPPIKLKKEVEDRTILTLLGYLGRKWALPDGATQEEKDAVHYVRRQAIKALAETRYPGVETVQDKKKTLEGKTALVLLRYIAKEGITPEPDLAEQTEAAIGLCQLQTKLLAGPGFQAYEYQPDYVAYHLGRFLVEFANRAQQEQGEHKFYWKLYAARLEQGLNELKEDTHTASVLLATTQYVAKLVAQATPVVQALEAGSVPNINAFSSWLDANPPTAKSVYKGVDDAVVKTGEKSE